MNDITIAPALLAEAETLNIDVVRAAEKGVAEAIERAKSARWREENRAALESSNAYVESYGLPLAPYRLF